MKQNNIDLGTLISAEMYTVSNEMKMNKEMKKKTFQQSTQSLTSDYVNVEVASPLPLPTAAPSEPEVREKKIFYGRELVKNDLIVEINCNLAKARIGNRYQRINAYFSIKTEHDIRYMIFLRSSLTTAHDEILRSIKKTNNRSLQTIAEDYIMQHPTDLLLGRIRYKPVNKYVTKQHRTNHKHGLFAIWLINDTFHGQLYLNGDNYNFEFNDDLSPAQIKAQYSLTSLWELDEGEIE